MKLKLTTLIIGAILALNFSKAQDLEGVKMAILTSDSTHDAELLVPYAFFTNQGAEVTIISDIMGEMNCYNSDITYNIEKNIQECTVNDYDVLLIPGGYAPAKLRKNEKVNQFVLDFANTGKLVAAICHGPQLLVPTGLLEGKKATCVKLMLEEYETSGIEFVNEHVVITDNIITGKNPGSVPQWCVAVKNEILKSK